MRWDPLHDFVAWHQRVQRAQSAATGWTPPVDVYETPDAYTIVIELAGLTADDFSVQATDDSLTVSGGRPPGRQSAHFLLVERGHGRFSRRFDFPHRLSVSDIAADFRDGLLTISVPKVARDGPQRVAVG